MSVTFRIAARRTLDPQYPVRDALDRFGDKWSSLVISTLASETLRFTELKRRIDGISQRMLTETVRGLKRDGVLLRTMYATIPPRVEYALTPPGHTPLEPIQALVNWALDHRAAIA